MQIEKSKALHQKALQVLVGGVNSPVRSFKRVGGQPLLVSRARGVNLWDVDENRYIDLVMSYGPHLFGHARSEIHEAVMRALNQGSTCYGMTSEAEIEWAELVLQRIPGAEKVRALSTGTEATSTAIRLARGITGREIVIKCAGHYHGHVDSLMVDAGSGIATLSTEASADSKGLPAGLVSLARVVEFNDIDALEALFAREGTKIAAFILEPIMGNMGVVPPRREYLLKARELCSRHGALLIFDEVMTGLRVHRNSAQGLFDVQPDLTCLGKIVGGGLPLSALCGPARFMNELAPLGGVYQAGTLSGNPISIAAGIAMLRLIDREDPYAKLEKEGQRFAEIFAQAAEAHKVPLRIERVASMISFYFRSAPVQNARDARETDEKAFGRFFTAMLEEGFMMPPSPFEACFLSTLHAELPRSELEAKIRSVFGKVARQP